MGRRKTLRTRLRVLLPVFLLLAAAGCARTAAAPSASTAPVPNTAPLSGSVSAQEFLQDLTDLGPRSSGTSREKAAADWIALQLEAMGYQVVREPFSFLSDSGRHSSENLIAVKKGRSDQQVLLGAHYDSGPEGKGADDNGSGTALLLEAACAFRNLDTPQTLRFVFFGAEEWNMSGSTHHAANMGKTALENTLLMVNFDSLIAGDHPLVYGNGDAKGRYRDFVLKLAENNHLELDTQHGENPMYPAGTTVDASDHVPFKQRGIPFIYFESTDWSLGDMDGYTQVPLQYGENGKIWHTAFDNLAYLDKTFPGRTKARLSVFSALLRLLLMEDLSKI